MKVEALRGVCIGVERHLKPGDTADLEPATVQFLVSIGAVKAVKDEPEAKQPETRQPEVKPEPATPEKSGRKEK